MKIAVGTTNLPKMISSGDITIRPMKDEEADYQLMAKWLADPRVLEFVYGEPKDIEYVKEHFGPRVRQEENVSSCFIEYQSQPVGYIQYFPVTKKEDYELETNEDVWAIDMWIGEPNFWDKGIGSKALKLVMGHIFKDEKAKKIIIDPHVDNLRAIHVYEKVGFKKVKILKAHEKYQDKKVDAWLMEIEI